MRKDEVVAWLALPVTQDFMRLLQTETRGNRERALGYAATGEGTKAAGAAAATAILRWALTDAIKTLASERDTKEELSEGIENNPEDTRADRLADALQEDDRDEAVDGDPRAGFGHEESPVLRGARRRSRRR